MFLRFKRGLNAPRREFGSLQAQNVVTHIMLRPLCIVGTPFSTKILPEGNLKNVASSFELLDLDLELSGTRAALSQIFAFLTRRRIPVIQQALDD